MSGDCGNSKELEFRYESNAASSFLVVGCRTRVLEFQAKMLENNAIRYIVPVETVKTEGNYNFYYNITSRISLLMYLKRYKLSRMEFLKLLLNLSSCINNSAGYLLSASNFVFDPEYVFIEPDTMEVRLIYIPAETGGHSGRTLQALISDVLMQHINEAGFGGNLVQRVLSEVRSEMFSLRSFMILLNELLYGEEASGLPVRLPEQDIRNKVLENSSKNDKIEEKQEDKENKESKQVKISLSLVIPVVLLQFVMGGIIFMCRSFLDNVGENRTATYAAVMMIVIAIDVLIFKKLQALKLFRAYNAGRTQQQRDISGLVDDKAKKPGAVQSDSPDKHGVIVPIRKEASAAKAYERLRRLTEGTVKEESPDTDTANMDQTDRGIQENIASRYTQKTEILSNNVKNVHMLKSKGKFSSDRDIVIDREEIIIGRLQGHVDHVLLNNAVGKLHAELICRNGSCFVKDLNSINGTFVNDIRIESNKEVELRNNDSLQFANSEFIYLCSQ
jgi:hypothetical protein